MTRGGSSSTRTSTSRAASTRSPDRFPATRAPRRSTTGTSGSTPSATARTPSAATSRRSRSTSARRYANWLARRPRTTRGSPARTGRGRRQRDGAGVPPLDPAARVACATGGPSSGGASASSSCGSAARRRASGCPRPRSTWPPCGCGRARHHPHDPRAVAVRRRRRRDPPAVPRRRRRRPHVMVIVYFDGPLSAAVSFDARVHRRGRPASPASAVRAPMVDGGRAGTAAHPTLRRSRPTASSTATTRSSGTCSSSAWSRADGSPPPRDYEVVNLATVVAESRPRPDDPRLRADLVELPPRRPALDRRVPVRRGRALEGSAAPGARSARGRHRQVTERLLPESAASTTRSGRPATATSTSSSGAVEPDAFAGRCLGGGRPPASARGCSTLLEAQRWRLAMFASDGWFWDEPSGSRPSRSCAPRRAPSGSWTATRNVTRAAPLRGPRAAHVARDRHRRLRDLPRGARRRRAAAAASRPGAAPVRLARRAAGAARSRGAQPAAGASRAPRSPRCAPAGRRPFAARRPGACRRPDVLAVAQPRLSVRAAPAPRGGAAAARARVEGAPREILVGEQRTLEQDLSVPIRPVRPARRAAASDSTASR